jgi:hypothetical protein
LIAPKPPVNPKYRGVAAFDSSASAPASVAQGASRRSRTSLTGNR